MMRHFCKFLFWNLTVSTNGGVRRFLRARRFHVDDAIQQFKATEEWRANTQLDLLYNTIDLQQYDETRRLVSWFPAVPDMLALSITVIQILGTPANILLPQYPQWTGRRDRRGIPVYIFEVAHLNSKTMSAYEKNAKETKSEAKSDGKTAPKLLRLFSLYENLTRFVMPLSTVLTDRDFPATPITQSNNIVDISNVGLKQFWNLRTHMQDASTLATANYPETLDRIFVIGAPSFFPTVWGWIKRWFDPITTSKIFILSNAEMKETLESFIEPENIPQKYGGTLDFKWGDLPKFDHKAMDEVTTWKNGYTDFPDGPMFWHDKGDHIELEAVGSVDGKPRHEIVCEVRKTAELRENQEKEKDRLEVASGRPISRMVTAGSLLKVRTIDEASKEALERGEEQPSRPELESFVTAREHLPTVSVSTPEGEGEGLRKEELASTEDQMKQRPTLPNNVSQATTINEVHDEPKSQPAQPPAAGFIQADRRASVGSSKESHEKKGKKLGKLLDKLHLKSHHNNASE